MNYFYNKYQISHLIFLYIKGNISENQKDLLFSWVDQSKENKELFKKVILKQTYENKLKVYKEFEKQYRWDKISYAISRKRKIHFRRISAVAATFLVLVSFLGYLFYNPSTVENNDLQSFGDEVSIVPGSKNAILITEEERVVLSKEIFKMKSSNVTISNNKSSISYQTSNSLNGINKVVYNTIIVPRGGEYKLILADGTQVWLNSESIIKYPISFNGDYRKVWLKGEGYFKVAENKKKPFFVTVDDKSIEVLGTSFNVKAYEDENNMVTTLQSGSVRFEYNGNSEILSPNFQIVYSETDRSIEVRKVDVDSVIAWVNGDFYFKSLDLKEIMICLARWYDFEIHFEDKETEDFLFRGFVNRAMDFQEVVNIIEETSNTEIQVEGKEVYISVRE